MKLEQSFEVRAPLERVWDALIDVERVAPCLPGASVSGRNDDGTYNGAFSVKIGPTSASYAGKLEMEEVDETAHRATMQANGTDKRGQGSAKATIVSTVTSAGEDRTQVEVVTDYHITGRLARFGRGGMIEDISEKLLRRFAEQLQQMLEGGDGDASAVASEAAPAEPPTGAAEAATETSTEVAPPPLAPTRVLPPSPSGEPVQGISLVVSVLWGRIRRNPIPAAFVAGLLAAFALLGRRRGR